jgi:DNA-binding LacI/PurR family transcriptional regulator
MAASIREIARLAGASPAAVSVTLNGTRGKTIRIGAATRERILNVASQLSYTPQRTEPGVRPSQKKVIGLILPYIEAYTDRNPFSVNTTNGILKEVINQHYNLMLFTRTSVNNSQLVMGGAQVDGVIMVLPPEDSPVLMRVESRHIPYVSIIREPIVGAATVNSDDFAGGKLATEHLISLGHRRIAHLVGDMKMITARNRRLGYIHALREANIPVQESLMTPAGFDWVQGYQAMKSILALSPSERPTAVVAANDLCADGAIRAINEHGLSVPDDIAIVGYDDTWFASLAQPALTSVRMPIEEMCTEAVKMVIALSEGQRLVHQHVMLPISLTVRASCGATRANKETP